MRPYYFSGLHLIRTAFDLKQQYTGDPVTLVPGVKRPEFWQIPKVLFFLPSEVNELAHLIRQLSGLPRILRLRKIGHTSIRMLT